MHSTRWSIHFLLALAYILLGVSQCNAGQVAMVSGGLTYSAVNVEKTAGAAFPDIAPSHLSSITSLDGFASLSHPAFPEHGVRIKKTEFCDPTVNVYTGYLDVAQGAKHLFFYFFESRRNPDKDDVVMWINGGPGCSSSVGLLMELGPCRIDNGNSSNGTIWNPYGWNAETNIFFLDQPVGVGFSYADFGETVGTTEDAAKDVYAFISIFFSTFRQFEGRPFHLAGESYAGRYLPVFASEIYDQTHLAPVEGRPTINLQSILIGNGITDISTLYPGRYAIECGTDSLGVPFQTIANCIRMKKALPRCQTRMKRSCIDMFDEMDCRAAIAFCDSELSAPLELSGRNPYDVSKSCVGSDLCYAEIETINAYLRRPDVVHLLGAQSPHPFSSCSEAVGNDFSFHFDKFAVATQHYVSNLLDRGVRVLIYAGTYDWRCNWVANKLWVDKLNWHGGANYVQEAWRDWHAGNATAGQTKSWGPLTFATVSGAGHMVPFDKPAESSHMISRWIAGEWL